MEGSERRHSRWIWVSALLAIVAVGLTIWALMLKSDLDSTQQELDTAINRALGRLAYGEVVDVFAALVIAGLAWLALWPRVGEYGG